LECEIHPISRSAWPGVAGALHLRSPRTGQFFSISISVPASVAVSVWLCSRRSVVAAAAVAAFRLWPEWH